jgi:hypothetical protein
MQFITTMSITQVKFLLQSSGFLLYLKGKERYNPERWYLFANVITLLASENGVQSAIVQ